MGNEKLFRVTAVSAITETLKMNQKFPITGETFDPYESDAPGFTLKSRKTVPAPARPTQPPKGTYADAAPQPPEEPAEGPRPEERLRAPKAAPAPTAKPVIPDLNARSLRRAVILSEVLAPPLARRKK